ncbi:GL22398 [Drosophila persimilis]|uniref:GL22398 n=1 Tax=Drosophila persimilis TaxID=7234 RepID=B4HA39_DROPE|nr:uncharacterized protein LOC6602691 [Drosophila persimilis]EDW36707.1 GL22398 [Drosophila persimilis]
MAADKTPPITAGWKKAKHRLPKRRLNDLHQCKASLGSHRHWGHSRVRRLIADDKYDAQQSPPNHTWMFQSCWCIVMLALGVLICGFGCYYDGENVSNFMLNYSKQYQAIIHNKQNYCDHTLSLNEMFGHIRRHVLNQETALDQLEQSLSKPQFQSISLLGSSGVGKSLTARLLRELFPWPENVHALTKSDVSDLVRMNSVLTKLDFCGRNLILVDNMNSTDQEIVQRVNDLVSSFGDIAGNKNTHKVNLKRLSIVYIFNINRFLGETSVEHFATVLQLPDNQVIQFDTLEPQHLESCIRHEADLENLLLDQKYVESMINTTDFKMSGCKTLRAKVLIYGQPKSNYQKD